MMRQNTHHGTRAPTQLPHLNPTASEFNNVNRYIYFLVRYGILCILLIIGSTGLNAQKTKSINLKLVDHSYDLSEIKVFNTFLLMNSEEEVESVRFLQLEERVNFKKKSVLFVTHRLPSSRSQYQLDLKSLPGKNKYLLDLKISNTAVDSSAYVAIANVYAVKKIESGSLIEFNVKYIDR